MEAQSKNPTVDNRFAYVQTLIGTNTLKPSAHSVDKQLLAL